MNSFGTILKISLSLVLIFYISLAPLGFPSANTQTTSNSISVSTTSQQYVKVIASLTSNITVLSVSGGQYDLSLSTIAGMNQLQFTPLNVTQYSLIVNVSSLGSNFAYVLKQNGAFATPIKNVTTQGNIILNFTITSLQPVSQGNSWDPLFGVTGIRVQGFSLSFPTIVGIMIALGVSLLALGIRFRSYLSYLGMMILSMGVVMVLGILVSIVILIAYILSFVGITVLWNFSSKKRNR